MFSSIILYQRNRHHGHLFDPGKTMIAYGEFGSCGFIAIEIPEPSTIVLLLLGLGTLTLCWRKR